MTESKIYFDNFLGNFGKKKDLTIIFDQGVKCALKVRMPTLKFKSRMASTFQIQKNLLDNVFLEELTGI